ncbi:MAG: 3-oxoacyl-[acyl-carrier-protein] reductase [Candidatus Glassbacteria bacterium]|nr:3-oxoacyl-[acyl-carrier-protein] reductase [Candidatus Glassbacteria bacterium]
MVLTERVALITGAGRGIGKAVALRLAAAGASVAAVDIEAEAAAGTAEEIRETFSATSSSFACDVSDYGQAASVVEEVIGKYGSLDILVNNAGITRDSLIMRMKPDDWDLVLRVNLTGAFNFTRAAARQMTKQRSGSIVNISSVVGLTGNAGQANYAASKAGLIGLTKSAAKEFAPRGVRVNAVAPGFIETEMTSRLADEVKEQWHRIIPLGRGGTAEDVASAVLFLAGPDSEYLTGQVIQVDGGMVM